jgi:hypothetical protein
VTEGVEEVFVPAPTVTVKVLLGYVVKELRLTLNETKGAGFTPPPVPDAPPPQEARASIDPEITK